MDRDARPAPAKHAAGDVISGKYRLVRPIGSGGSGTVWLARNEVLAADVAVKLLRFKGDEHEVARFLQEARTAARVAHEGVARLFELEQSEAGVPFIVMELLEGETLRARLDRAGRMRPVDAVRTMLPVAHTLCALADQGIVHRDLKPSNIVLVPAGEQRTQPKLVDFGFALAPDAKRFTEAGVIVGTVDYCSPEQVTCSPVDARADVWAFAVILFEMIGGKLPFRGRNLPSTLQAIVAGPPPAMDELGAADAELKELIERGLRRDRDARFPSMRAFGEALATWAVKRGADDDVAGGSLRARWSLRLPPSASKPRPKARSSPSPVAPEAPAPIAPPPSSKRGLFVMLASAARRRRNVVLTILALLGAGAGAAAWRSLSRDPVIEVGMPAALGMVAAPGPAAISQQATTTADPAPGDSVATGGPDSPLPSSSALPPRRSAGKPPTPPRSAAPAQGPLRTDDLKDPFRTPPRP